MRGFLVAVLLAGCAGPMPAAEPCPPFALVEGVQRMCVDGVERALLIHVPDSPDGTLIIALHGGGGWAARMAGQTRFHEAAPHAIVVYPEGVGIGESGLLRTWNAMHCCGPAFRDGVDDVAFIAAIIAGVEAAAGPQRVLITGHSNGAMMAYRFAAERPDVVDGVAVVSGTIGGIARPGVADVRIPVPTRPVPVLIVHGSRDEQVPYDGGAGNETLGGRMDASVADAVAFWQAADYAPGPPVRVEGDIVTQTYAGAATVTVVTTPAGHAWPTEPEAGVDATALIVTWFYAL